MAYASKEKKEKIVTQLKQIMPKDWKWSLATKNNSTFVLTIRQAPVNLLEGSEGHYQLNSYGHYQLNSHYLDKDFNGKELDILEKAKKALNTDNFNNSDLRSDYFHVGHYIEIQFGNCDKPFICSKAA